MKKIVFLLLSVFCVVFLIGCTGDFQKSQSGKIAGMPNPWTDCNMDLECGAKIAGFKFPLVLSNYKARAMKDMFEITYPLDETRELIVRKSASETFGTENGGDFSGDYNNYPIKESVTLDNGVVVTVRRDEKLVYVMYFGAEQGYYTVNCLKGMTMKEVKGAYETVAEAEAPKAP